MRPHDYVGNTSTDASSTDQSLAAATTTCLNGDLSTYYWPVLRLLGGHAPDAHSAGGGMDGNTGDIQRPAAVAVRFFGNPVSQVVPMPRFLRLGAGDARALTEGGRDVVPAQWGCDHDPGRVTTHYPLCPGGSRVTRTFDFPSCWDGVRTDSPDHRSHTREANGVCPAETFPVPRLRVVVAYVVPAGRRFAIDSFPDQRRSPTTDHAFFIDVMPDALMTVVARCINQGRAC